MRRLLACACLLAAFAATAAPAPADVFEDAVDDCFEATPHAIAPPFGAAEIKLGVLVLLDGVTEAEASAAMATEATSYAPLGIDLVPVAYQTVALTKVNSSALIDESRELVGGKRPAWAHLVYTFTNKDMTGSLGPAVAGQADCIGGVAFPESAFAVGELRPDDFDPEQPAKIGAHEIGHLMGAHHHYANCVEGLDPDPFYPCTLMINDVGLASLNLSTFNAAVVRGHAEEFAKPLPAPGSGPAAEPSPDPEPSPTATPSGTPPPGEPRPGQAPGSGPAPAPTAPGSPSPSGSEPPPASKGSGCAAARRALTRAKRAERAARRVRARARKPAARRRATRTLARRTAARRAAQRTVRSRCG